MTRDINHEGDYNRQSPCSTNEVVLAIMMQGRTMNKIQLVTIYAFNQIYICQSVYILDYPKAYLTVLIAKDSLFL